LEGARSGERGVEPSTELARRMAMRIANVPVDHQEAALAAVQGELEAMKKSAADKSVARQWVDASMEEIRRLAGAIGARSKTGPRSWGR
jgi:hypothetical protein